MATKTARLAEFTTDAEPTTTDEVELLCEDHCGTYLLPFACYLSDHCWLNKRTGEKVEARVLGWRYW